MAIETTPELVSEVYKGLEENITKYRKMVNRPLTLTEKLLIGHLDNIQTTKNLEPGESYVFLRPDRVALQDVTGQMVILQFMQSGLKLTKLLTTVHCDHLIQARVRGDVDTKTALDENSEVYKFLESASRKYGIGFWKPGAGIIHQVVLENYAFPGGLMIGTDSHTPNAGGLGMLAVGVGGLDAAEVMAGLSWEPLYSKRIVGFLNRELLSADPEVEQNPQKYFDKIIEVDLSTLEPYIVGPHTPDLARPISQLAEDVKKNNYLDSISVALIGSCTNSSYEDMTRVANVAQQAKSKGIKVKIPLLVTPGSEQIRATIERDGQMETLTNIGATVLANACGPCIGQWKRPELKPGEPNTIVTSFNRNFPGRNDGRRETMSFMGSPELVVALALGGKLSFNPLKDSLKTLDGSEFRLEPPNRAPEVPSKGFTNIKNVYSPPSENPAKVEVIINPNSSRLQKLEPFQKWDGKDFLELPILLKAKGKCTTDHISPAGPWLMYRGHLDKISDNIFLGAVNAFTNEVGKGKNQLTEKTESFPVIARQYKENGLHWIVIGDNNYGEGSSREHAAMSPRYLGCVAVIARGFARIHETNLKKQGVLALTFANSSDYDKIMETDRISLVGLKDLKPGKPVNCIIRHKDGSKEEISLRHSYNDFQIQWFQAGSALNIMRESEKLLH